MNGSTEQSCQTRALRTADAIAALMDNRFRIPGTRIRFGWDAIVGILPGVGDTATALVGGATVLSAIRLGARRRTVAAMIVNLFVDWLIGLVPVAGFVLDTLYKAHSKNAALLRREIARASARSPDLAT